MPHKPFDQVLHDENDAIAKEAVRSFLEAAWGYPVTEGGQYDVDLVIYENEEICGYVEVERRHNWNTQHFPFDTLHIPERKRKFFTLDQPSLLFAVSKDCRWGIFVPGEIVLNCPVKMLDNKFCFQEPFFIVPIEYCMLVDLEKKPDGANTPPGQPCDQQGGGLTFTLGGALRTLKRHFCWGTLCARSSHSLATASLDTLTLSVNVCIQSGLLIYRHFHLLSDALARVAGPLAFATTPRIRAQNDFLRPSSFLVLGLGAGALRLLPVSRLYLARPLAVKPAPCLTDCFSPRPTESDTLFFSAIMQSVLLDTPFYRP